MKSYFRLQYTVHGMTPPFYRLEFCTQDEPNAKYIRLDYTRKDGGTWKETILSVFDIRPEHSSALLTFSRQATFPIGMMQDGWLLDGVHYELQLCTFQSAMTLQWHSTLPAEWQHLETPLRIFKKYMIEPNV